MMPLDAITVPGPFDRFNENSPILFPVAERKVGWAKRDGSYESIGSHKAIVRLSKDGSGVHVLNVVGNTYKLIHNRELFGHVEEMLCKKLQGDALDDVRVNDKVAGWGRVCLREYVFPNIKCDLARATKSSIAFRLIVQNGYGGSALRMHAGAIDFFCTNGMISGEYQSTYNKHTSGLMVSGVGHSIDRALDTFAASKTAWTRWAETEVKHDAAMQLFRDLASTEKLRDNLTQRYLREREDRGPTLWAVYSTLTYYASHDDTTFPLRALSDTQDSRVSTMLQRELRVAKWIRTDAWKKLEAV